ncbi:MAG: outer membrane protein assembly factor BamB [Alteromonadaceae bacterium]|nr:outer membrane protein assembly factor BamB [Alteromonadaceae bacterium]
MLSSTLMACSSTDDEDEATKVAELPEITQQFKVDTLWSKNIDGIDGYFSRLKSTVAYGALFSANRDGDVYAFNIDTGKEQWHTDISALKFKSGFFDSRKSAMLSGGVVAGMDKVFVGSENGELYALDAKTGDLLWQSEAKGEIIAAPAIDSGIVVVNTVSGLVKAFDAKDGKEVWSIEQEVPPLSLRGTSSPVIASGGVLVGGASGDMTVYMLTSGQEGWTTALGDATGSTELDRVIDIDSSPIVFGDKLYAISSRGSLAAIDLRSGRIVWKRQYSSYRSIALEGNNIYITDIKGHVYSIGRINGLEQWSQLLLTNRGVTGPVVVGKYIVVGDFEGYLHWIDKETGEMVARHQVDNSAIYATPIVDKGIIYAESRDGDIEAIKTP